MYTCDVMIYNKKCIFDLIFILISGTEFLKPLEFLKEWEWQRCLLLSGDFQTLTSRWGWMPEEPTMWLDSWNFQSFPLTPNLPGREGVWKLSSVTNGHDLINHAYEMEPP